MRYDKLAPGLLVALDDYQTEGREGLLRHTKSLGVIPSVGSPRPPRAVVFVHCDPAADLSHLAAFDIRVNQPRGRVRTAYLPLDSLERLSDDAAVDLVSPSRYLRLLLDVAGPKVHLPTFRARSGLTGRNVIVGVVDTGIDPRHPAFSGRILRIWDQVLPGPGVDEGGYGIELSGPLLTVSRDTNGHGTHVAGIAAGADSRFGGVAPEADLVIVKTDLQTAHIADGIRYIFRVARDLGRPAVVNLSLGGHDDAHDGTDPLSQVIDDETGPGRIVCCAAGNEGNDNIHAQTTVPPGATRTIRFRVPPGLVGVALLNGWYPGARSLEVAVRSPAGFLTAFQGVITDGSPERTYTLPDARVAVVTAGPNPFNDDHQFLVALQGRVPGQAVAGGVWQLRVRNVSSASAVLDIWVLDDHSLVGFIGRSVQDSMKIGSPGAAASAVTVASYTTRVEWTDVDGAVRRVGLDLDDISDFSSEGPLRKGGQKPDLAAPGAMIVSAMSADSTPERATRVGEHFVANAGTSMATPYVSGLVALLLQRDATLDPAGVKALLRAHSRIPRKPAGTFDPKWGLGLINTADL